MQKTPQQIRAERQARGKIAHAVSQGDKTLEREARAAYFRIKAEHLAEQATAYLELAELAEKAS